MLNRFPTQISSLSMLLDDIGRPKPKAIAKAFHVSERSVHRWIKADFAPWPVMLALFYLTRWGHNWVHTEAHNTALLHIQMAVGLRGENRALRERLQRMAQIGQFGAANDPAEGIALPMSTVLTPESDRALSATFHEWSSRNPSSSARPTTWGTKENQGVPLGEPVQPLEPINIKEAAK
jgi:hypothetical protein